MSADDEKDRVDEDVELARADREELGENDDEPDEPQPWAKALPGDE